MAAPAGAIAKSGADAVLIAQGGVILRALAPTLSLDGATKDKVKLLGTGLWDDDPSLAREAALEGSWYAAPAPDADAQFIAKYRGTFGTAPAQLSSLAYDAVSLVALLSQGDALSPLHPEGADGSQWLCRRQRHLPLQSRRHVRARPGGAGNDA